MNAAIADGDGMGAAHPIKTVILGNSGSGKSTLAHAIADGAGLPILALDAIAWDASEKEPVRRAFVDTVRDIEAFIDEHDEWVIEGCYGDLIEAILPHCNELVFLNPGVEKCLDRAKGREWEPDKYATPEEQDNALAFLLDWIGQYDSRLDEYGLRCHKTIFATFTGAKRELVRTDDYGV
jgi:adenylate kinase family enzyme